MTAKLNSCAADFYDDAVVGLNLDRTSERIRSSRER